VNNDGVPVYLADPGINGVYEKRPDSSTVQKFTAPKATLVSYIIKGSWVGNCPVGPRPPRRFHRNCARAFRRFPRSLLPSVVIFRFLDSAPIYVGGMVRWLIDRHTRRKHAAASLTEDQLVAEGDKSNGVLLSSGYIARPSPACSSPSSPSRGSRASTSGKMGQAHNPFLMAVPDLLAMLPFCAPPCYSISSAATFLRA